MTCVVQVDLEEEKVEEEVAARWNKLNLPDPR